MPQPPLDSPLSLPQLLATYGCTLLALLALDALWLTLYMGKAYKAALGDLLLSQPRLIPALCFYLLFALGLTVFAVLPAVRADSWRHAAALGALLGLVAYATYDLTNLSILKGWPPGLTLIDILWGAALSCLAGSAGYAAASRLAMR